MPEHGSKGWRRHAVAIGAATALALGTSACNGASGDSGSGVIKIGVLAPQTGSVAAEGQAMVRASELIVEQVNADGGIGGRKIELEIADDACDAQQGTQAAQKLASQGVVAVVGGFCSGASLPAQEVFKRSGNLPFVIAVSSNPELTEAGATNVVRIIGRDDQEGPVLADYVTQLGGSSRLAIMNDNTEYSRSTAEQLKKALAGSSIDIVYDDAIQPGQNDYRAALERVGAAGADTLLYTGFYPEFGILAAQWKRSGLGYKLVGGASTIDATVLDVAGTAAESDKFCLVTYATTTLIDSPAADRFRKQYVAEYDQEPGSYTVFQADGMQALVEALKADPDALDPADVAERLRQVDIVGITGEINFDDKGDRSAFPFLVVRSRDGAWAEVASYSTDEGWIASQ
jgi:ABC-type branched-subunit amino acid transport system substrate-binding protein